MRWLLTLIITVNCFGYYRSDINQDGITNLLDFQILASEWLWESEGTMANNYLTFNGTTQYVSVPDNAALNFGTGDFSISFWVNSSGGIYPLIDKGMESCRILIYPDYTLKVLFFDEFNNYGWDFSSSSAIPSGWAHCVVVKNNSGISIYFNGSSVGMTEYVKYGIPNLTNSNQLYIGSDNSYFLSGSLDDLRIYKGVALNSDQIAQIYNSGYGCKYTAAQQFGADSVVAFQFDEGLGDYTLDSVQGLLGTLTGNVANNMWVSGGVPISQTASIEEGVYDILVDDTNLNTVISSRIYPSIVPQYAATPCITYQQISGIREQLLSGADGFVSARFQINCWADTYGGARNIANLVRRALASKQGEFQGVYIYDIQIEDENDMPQIDAENENISRYGKRLDFIVYFNE